MVSSTQPEVEWVVGFDGSRSARAAARWALANAAGRTDSIRLVQAWSVSPDTVYSVFAPVALADTMSSIEKSAGEELQAFADELSSDASIPIRTTLRPGDAASVLLAEAGSSEQLVLGARGGGRFERLRVGSTSTRCATHATVPTVIVHDEPKSSGAVRTAVQSIVVGFDGSQNAVDAVDWACTFAAPGSTVDIFAVWEFAPSLFSNEAFHYPEAMLRAKELYEEQIEQFPGSTRRTDIDVAASFVEGRPRDQIAELAADADLVVVGGRGRGAIGAALLGSVSTWLLHHLQQPITVVPHRLD